MTKNKVSWWARSWGTAIVAGSGALLWHHGLSDAHVKYILMAAAAGIVVASARELASGITWIGAAVRGSPFAAYLPARLSGKTPKVEE